MQKKKHFVFMHDTILDDVMLILHTNIRDYEYTCSWQNHVFRYGNRKGTHSRCPCYVCICKTINIFYMKLENKTSSLVYFVDFLFVLKWSACYIHLHIEDSMKMIKTFAKVQLNHIYQNVYFDYEEF